MGSGERQRYGSDVIVDLLEQAGIEHVAFNPGASFRGIHDSLVQAESGPAVALCLHEAVSVAVAQGYAKAAGRPMAVLLHDVVGLQNATMAIYNAWCDRVPMLLIGGTGPKSKARRRPWIDWVHTASVQANLIRDFVKWDDEPQDLESVPESFARAWTAATSAPEGPVYVCYDVALQEDVLPAAHVAQAIGAYRRPADPAPPAAALNELASRLRQAERPALLAGYTGGDPTSFDGLGELAELLAAPVIDTQLRLALPTDHPLNGSGVDGLLGEADAVLALDVDDLTGPLKDSSGVLLTAGTGHLKLRGWSDDHQPLVPAELQLTATAGAVIDGLLERCRPHPRQDARASELKARIAEARARRRATAAAAGADQEDAVPLERLIIALDEALKGQRFTLTNGTTEPLDARLWTLTRPRQGLGWAGGGGLGYGAGAGIGAALANGPDTISVVFVGDGDLLYLPSALWTAAHLRLPVLIVVHDNRQYANTVGHARRVARARGRGEEHRHTGASLSEPPVDLVALARSFGLWATGPITDPRALAAALEEATTEARAGRPALLDVITPGL